MYICGGGGGGGGDIIFTVFFLLNVNIHVLVLSPYCNINRLLFPIRQDSSGSKLHQELMNPRLLVVDYPIIVVAH